VTPPEGGARAGKKWGPRYTRSDLTLANAFTAARIILIPIFGWLWYHGDGASALWIFAIAVATDLIDGFLARYLNQHSRLGALLDPMADKLLVFVALIVGVLIGAIPVWFLVVIVARDALLAVGAILLTTRWRPTRIGKYAMTSQSLAIVLVLMGSTLDIDGLAPYTQVAMIFTAALTITAGTQYTLRAVRAV
jgi:cardiolipin synthase (CMP-forming)